MKKNFFATVSLLLFLLSEVHSVGQITGVELARTKQKE